MYKLRGPAVEWSKTDYEAREHLGQRFVTFANYLTAFFFLSSCSKELVHKIHGLTEALIYAKKKYKINHAGLRLRASGFDQPLDESNARALMFGMVRRRKLTV